MHPSCHAPTPPRREGAVAVPGGDRMTLHPGAARCGCHALPVPVSSAQTCLSPWEQAHRCAAGALSAGSVAPLPPACALRRLQDTPRQPAVGRHLSTLSVGVQVCPDLRCVGCRFPGAPRRAGGLAERGAGGRAGGVAARGAGRERGGCAAPDAAALLAVEVAMRGRGWRGPAGGAWKRRLSTVPPASVLALPAKNISLSAKCRCATRKKYLTFRKNFCAARKISCAARPWTAAGFALTARILALPAKTGGPSKAEDAASESEIKRFLLADRADGQHILQMHRPLPLLMPTRPDAPELREVALAGLWLTADLRRPAPPARTAGGGQGRSPHGGRGYPDGARRPGALERRQRRPVVCIRVNEVQAGDFGHASADTHTYTHLHTLTHTARRAECVYSMEYSTVRLPTHSRTVPW